MTPKTLFAGGSTTKSQTAAALSILIDDNETYPGLSWKTPISHVLRDDFVLMDDWATHHVTFEDAASHRTGMPRHDTSYGSPTATQKDITRSLRYLPMTAEPRTTFQYCNMMFAVIGDAIETLTGTRLGDFFRERLWHPLDMHNTFLYNDEARQYVKSHDSIQIATPYQWIPHADESESPGHFSAGELLDISPVAGAGAVLTNVEDYAKYLRAMLHESGPISKAAYKELKTPRTIDHFDDKPPYLGPTLYSLGWEFHMYRGHQVWEHGGSTIGYGAFMGYLPDDNLGLVCLANTMVTSNRVCDILQGFLIEETLQVPSNERFNWTSRAREQEKEQQPETDLTKARRQMFPEVVRRHPPGPIVPMEHHEGIFTHPAYQTANVTVRYETSGRQMIHVALSPRSFHPRIDLHHVSYEWFLIDDSLPWAREELERSPGKYPYGDEGPTAYIGRALFIVGSNGKVTKLGMELEKSMVEKAEREGKPREEGMIWFDKIS